MPLGSKPICSRCKNTESSMWRKGAEGEVLCNYCGVKKMNGNGSEGKSDSESSKSSGKVNINSGQQYIGPVRKSARLKPSKYKGQYNPKALATKGKSRRVIFKKNVRPLDDSFFMNYCNAYSSFITQSPIFIFPFIYSPSKHQRLYQLSSLKITSSMMQVISHIFHH